MKKYIGLLLTAILWSFSASIHADTSDIGHFEDDWGVWFVPDDTNIDNCKIYIKFLYHHKNNDDGWRKKEGGANFEMNGTYFGRFYGDGDKIEPVHWERDSRTGDNFKGWTFPNSENDFEYTTETPQFETHSCAQRHFRYAKMFIIPAAKDLGKQMSVKVRGEYWRWGDGWKNDHPNRTRSFWAIYDVDPGDFIIDNIDLDDSAKPYITVKRFDGNSSKYSTFYVKENGSATSQRSEITNNTERQSYPNEVFEFALSDSKDKFCRYQSTPVEIETYAEAFADVSSLHKTSTPSKLSYYGFPTPYDLKVQYDLEEHCVYLKWNKSPIPDYATSGRWYIRRVDETNNVTTTFDVDLDADSYTDIISENTTYSYQVYYHRDSWDKTRFFSPLATNMVQASVIKDVNLQISKTEILDDRINFFLTFNGSKKDGFYKLAVTRDNLPVKIFSDIKAQQNTIEWSDIYDADSNPLNFKKSHTYQFSISRTRPYAAELQSVTTVAAASGTTRIENFSATLGVKTSDVHLRWDLAREYTASYTDTFRIERRRCCDTDNDYIVVPGADEIVTTAINNTFIDQNCTPGVMYFYRLQLMHNQKWMDVSRTMGYVISTGSISGRITYANGLGESSDLACPDADIYITPFKADNSDQQAFPMRCRIVSDGKDSIAIPLTDADLNQLQKAHTLAYWKKDESTNNVWQHFAYRSNADGIDSLFISDQNGHINQILENKVFSANLSFSGDNTSYDEIQLWNRALTKDEILNYSLRHLDGEEDGLLAYLPMDESFSYGYCFDQALNGSQSRGHHALLTPSVSVSNLAAPVSFRTKTDINGNYSIKGLPFGEDGDNIIYRIMPVRGAHVFSPATQNLLLSSDNKTYTQRDFTDETSVNVSGLVYYRYGNFPVSGATILVDGKPVSQRVTVAGKVSDENVTTDSNGKYCVIVSSGQHEISVSLEGHTFTQSVFTIPGTANVKDLDFEDNTLMKLWGRVAGGSTECDKVLPSYESANANIGQATLYLRPTSNRGYVINTTSAAVELGKGDERINNTTTLQAYDPLTSQDYSIAITTDAQTGEFCALLPPISYTITGGFTQSVPNDSLKAYEMPEINPVLHDDGIFSDTCVIRFDPKPECCMADACHPDCMALGLDSITVGGNKFALFHLFRDLDNPNILTDSIGYTLGHPVYQAGTRQCMYIYLQQRFYNAERKQWTEQKLPEGTQVSFVNCNINATDDEQSNIVTLDKNGSATYSYTVQDPNPADNSFVGIQASYALNNRTFLYPDTAIQVIILGDNISEGTGVITEGPDQVDFVLHRPPGTNSSATLHSGSTIVSMANVNGSVSDDFTFNNNFSAGGGANWRMGLFKVGFRVNIIEKSSYSNNTTRSTASSSIHVGTVAEDITTPTGAQFASSSGNVFVGHANVKLIGKSYKYGFVSNLPAKCLTTPIKLVNDEGKTCYLVGYEGDVTRMAADESVGFSYTRYYIENSLIPEVKKLRNGMILAPTDDSQVVFGADEKVKYVSEVPVDNSKFGEENTYRRVFSADATDVDKSVNDVLDCNNWIKSWEQVLADDERDCINANCNDLHTISGGVSYTASCTSDRSTSSVMTTGYTYTNTVSHGFSVQGDRTSNKIDSGEAGDSWPRFKQWLSEMKEAIASAFSKGNAGGGVENLPVGVLAATPHSLPGATMPHYAYASGTGAGSADFSWISSDIEKFASTESSNTTIQTKLSYTLKDSDPYDFLTVGISDTTNANALCYRIMGGATTNPWEGGETTKYYNPGMTLNNATMIVQKPIIKFEKSVITDVPSGHTATLNLSITNGSEINVPQYYNVALIASSNPDGLIVEMDGRPLAQGAIPVWLEAGQTVNKTLTIRQSREDVMDYDEVKIFAAGKSILPTEISNPKLCPNLAFSVHFKPSCSDINLAITDLSGRSINTINSLTGDKVRFTVSDYDLNYKGFQKIMLQRYDRSLQQWQTFHQWYLDSKEALQYGADSVCGRSSLSFDYDVSTLADDTYQMRAVTSGIYGTEEIPYEAPAIEIVKDVNAPRPLGSPSPISGILTSDGEISISFNEDIYKEQIVDADITVTGELNNEKLLHDTGIEFTGGDPVLSTTPITISRGGSSLEMWLQREPGKAGTVFSHGTTNSRFAFGYDADDHFWMQVAGEKFVSEKAIKTTGWQFLHVGFDEGQLAASCMWNDDEGDHSEWIANSNKAFNYNNRAIFRFGEGFTGKISQISSWNTSRTDLTEIAATKDLPHTAGETGIQAYWPCSECHGVLVADHVAENSLSLPFESYWYISQTNHSGYFAGEDSLVINAENIQLDEKSDYTVEMWINASKGSSDSQGILASYAGSLTLVDGCPALAGVKVYTRDLRDDKWHHLALNVMYGKSVTFLVDGKVTKTVDADTISNYIIQNGDYSDYTPHRYVIGKNFLGEIDELRIWSSNLSHDVIRDAMYRRMTGHEKGLSLLVNMEDESMFGGQGKPIRTLVSPALQPSRLPQSVRHTWTASDRKIVITPTESPSVMEDCTLYITVDKIADVHGNVILYPITWNAKVNRSTLSVSNNLFNHIMIEGYASTEHLSIANKGYTSDVVSITNVPSWLTLSDNDFTIEPYKTKQLTMEIPEDIPVGNYSTTLLVTSQATGISESVVFNLTVTSRTPYFNVNKDAYNSSCSVIAMCSDGENFSENEFDEVVAYVIDDDNTPVYLGEALNTYLSNIGGYRFLLNIYFDAESSTSGYTGTLKMTKDRNIHFLYWDDANALVHPELKLYDANGNEISLTLDNMENFRVYGSPTSPCEFITQNIVWKTLTYEKGWNWRSLNTVTADDQFEDYFPANGSLHIVKTQSKFSVFDQGKWTGELQKGVTQYFRNMYMVEAQDEVSNSFQGTPVTPSQTTITVRNGWTWLPYYPLMRMPIAYALREVAMPGDLVKGQDGFSYYTETGWVGTLTNLQPDAGYMYYRSTGGLSYFSYPDSYIPTYKAPRRAEGTISDTESLSDSISHAYSMNMSAILAPVCNDEAITSGTVYAYDPQGNLRGVAEMGNVTSASVVFMSISGDSNFKVTLVIRTTGGQSYIAKDALDYVSNSLVGTPSAPLQVDFTATEDVTTDIASLRAKACTRAYDLSGRRTQESSAGVVIVNGKKNLNK